MPDDTLPWKDEIGAPQLPPPPSPADHPQDDQ